MRTPSRNSAGARKMIAVRSDRRAREREGRLLPEAATVTPPRFGALAGTVAVDTMSEPVGYL